MVVLVSTSGFSVFHHSCNSEKLSEYSLLIPEFSCKHYQDESEELPPCCSASKGNHDKEACGTDDCCNTEVITVKLSTTFTLKEFKFKTELPAVALIDRITDEPSPVGTTVMTRPVVSNDLAPPLSGRALHIFLQQLNIPNPSV